MNCFLSSISRPHLEFNSSTIRHDDDSFLLVEFNGYMAQYFLTASPRHPMMFFALTFAVEAVLHASNAKRMYAAYLTGPRATKRAHSLFTRKDNDEVSGLSFEGGYSYSEYGGNRSFRIGNHNVLLGNALRRRKERIYKSSNVTYWLQRKDEAWFNDIPGGNCFQLLNITGNDHEYTYKGNKVVFTLPVVKTNDDLDVEKFEAFLKNESQFSKLREKVNIAVKRGKT